MVGESLPQRLADDVAEAADAWLRDPRDTGVYTRLVQAIERWRTVTRPTLGLAHQGDDEPAGDRDGPVRLALAIDEFRRALPDVPVV